jgi:hypothetical protein
VHTRRTVPFASGFRVFRSPIHGYGVVATRDYAAGELIADVEGILYEEEDLGDDTYCLWVEDGFYYDMVDQTRWINHSCEPNADIEAELDGQGGAWARVLAQRAIRKGEEITYDYAFSEHLAVPCACGTRSCKGWIVDSDELPALQARLLREQAGSVPSDR